MAGDLTPPRSARLTRQQLAQFLPNQELIRAFEALSLDVTETAPGNDLEIIGIARLALALAGQALAMAEAGAEDQLIIPGPRGADGAAGLAVAFMHEPESIDEPMPVAARIGAPVVGGSRVTDAWRTALIAALVAQGLITDTSTP